MDRVNLVRGLAPRGLRQVIGSSLKSVACLRTRTSLVDEMCQARRAGLTARALWVTCALVSHVPLRDGQHRPRCSENTARAQDGFIRFCAQVAGVKPADLVEFVPVDALDHEEPS